MAANGQTRIARRKQKKAAKKPIWKKILIALSILIFATGLSVGGLFTYYIATAPKLDAAKLEDPFSSQIYDMNGELIGDLGGEKRTKVEYDELPDILIDAVIATEDSRFFEHFGIDLRRIGGAIISNIKNGFGSEGASTITQQVVENSFLSSEKKLKLKVQEQWLALKLERNYTKEQILEMYLNKIFYGNNAYGVAKAAEVYFGKTDLHDLTLPEAAILAGLPQRPTAYNPFKNPDLTKKRMNTVLSLMVRHGKISEEEADEAREVDIASLLTDSKPKSKPYEGFVQQVEKEVKEKIDGADIYTDGLKIYTTLDPDIQEHVEFLLSDDDDNPIPYPDDIKDADGKTHKMQAGMTVLDTQSGAIRAIGGARGGVQNDSWNYAIDGDGRQPGSTFKPIIAYGPAIEYNKYSTYHQLHDDEPYKLEGTDKVINNYDGQFHGWMSMRTALSESYNVPAMKLFDEVDRANAQQFAENLGIQFDDGKLKATDTIGGGSGVTPLELAGAYRAFANEGIYNEPYSVSKVEFPDGRTVDLKPESEAVMSDYTAYMVTDMLKTVVNEGTGTLANIPGLPVAGKTGTTNRPGVDTPPDSWFSGYTKNYTISIWTGYADNDIGLPNTKIPHALFKNTMSEISKDIDTPDWTKPDSVVEVAVKKGSNPPVLASDQTPDSETVTELFVKGTEPSRSSENDDKDELDPVENLTAIYDEDTNSIHVEWDYDTDEDVMFEVSASVDDGDMQSLSSTDNTEMEIENVELGTEYVIQVVVVSNDDDSKTSEAKTTTVNVPGESDDEDEEEDEHEDDEEDSGEDIASVTDLNAVYDSEQSIIDVSWNYNGPPAVFEVTVSPGGQTQTVDAKGIEIAGITPGETYTITVTPVGQTGANEGVKGESQRVDVSIPDDEDVGADPDPDPEEEEAETEEELEEE